MSQPGPGSDGVSLRRPLGVSAGVAGLVLAWLGGVAIVQLTGAVAVMIVLATTAIAAIVAGVAGWLALGNVRVGEPSMPSLVERGVPVAFELPVRSDRPVWVEVRDGDAVVASGWTDGVRLINTAMFGRRGVVSEVEVGVRVADPTGLLWWRRSVRLPLDDVLVAEPPNDDRASVERASLTGDGELAGRAGAVAGEIDGVRPWRDGDSDKWVHWASTLRAGELVVHDRRQDADESWLVRARLGRPDPDAEAGAVRNALEAGLRRGAVVAVAIGDDEPCAVTDSDDAARWSAMAELGEVPVERPSRRWLEHGNPEPDTLSTFRARWWAAGSTALSLILLVGVLGAGPAMYAFVVTGTALGAWVSGRALVDDGPSPTWLRAVVGAGSVLALLVVVASSGRVDGLLEFLSGPLPQVLIVLVVLHGFECRDRRSVRVSLGVSAVVVMYAAAFRVDDRLVWWLAAWGVVTTIALSSLANRPERSEPSGRRVRSATVAFAAAVAGTLALLAVIPVPSGPAVLALPSLLEGEVDTPLPGAVVGPDGEVRDDGSADSDGDRAPAGQPGGYVGFSETMDTSVRGDLGDQIVMRVRAPEAAFWRGQTFDTFDGRRWYADDEYGRRYDGPVIDLPSTMGNIRVVSDVEVDEFVQTYYFERDMPNVVFHAERPVRLFIETDVFVRPDGALRAATTLPDEAVYTVVSSRPRIDADRLRQQGPIGERLTAFGQEALADYLAVPESTTPETIALADELAAGASNSYDVVQAYEAWLDANVEYDLNAPLPDPGEDAIHDFLFDTRLGFCEQIASALTIMLRTQGIPTRLVTGYIPGERDSVTGVFEVRASDAHAWVEVWFPETGWQAFDPTAGVPLSADAEAGTVGEELVSGLSATVEEHGARLVAVIALGAAAFGAWWVVREMRRRQRRGRWGLLQDRFTSAAVGRGALAGATNPDLARVWADDDRARTAATELDRAAFDPAFVDDDETYRTTRELVDSLQ